MPAHLAPLVGQLLLAQAPPADRSPWVPLTQWSDIPLGLVAECVAVPLIILTVVWGVWHYRTRWATASYYSPRRLFNDLCALHGLDWPTRKLLRQLARCRHLEHPARVFLEPACFDPANVPLALQPFQDELQQLKTRLFSGR
jgi:hypothetical protein